MKLEKAIERLEQHTRYLESLNAFEQVEAHQLGIEAIKRVAFLRERRGYPIYELLPGETEE